jgi:ABC-type glycerol-3-phosphate transport system permease component
VRAEEAEEQPLARNPCRSAPGRSSERPGGDQTVVAAATVLVAISVILFYVLLQRQFLRGFLAGAVKE